jgi:hypothetical protein
MAAGWPECGHCTSAIAMKATYKDTTLLFIYNTFFWCFCCDIDQIYFVCQGKHKHHLVMAVASPAAWGLSDHCQLPDLPV